MIGARRFEAQFPADTSQLVRIRAFVRAHASLAGFDEAALDDLELAVDEGCSNVIRHAYPPGQTQPGLHLTVQVDEPGCTVIIADQGQRFDLARVATVDLVEHRARFRRGGLGIHLMRALTDHVDYRSDPGHGNQLQLVKIRH